MSIPPIHPDPRTLGDHLAGRLPVAERLAVSDHLAVCPACRAALAKAHGETTGDFTWRLDLPPLLPEAPPIYEEMAALLDGTLSAAQSGELRDRLAASPLAAEEFADLRRFRDEAAALPSKAHGPGAEVPAIPRTTHTPGRIIKFPGRHWPQLTALAAAAVVLLAAGWWAEEAGKSFQGPAPLWADADLSGLSVDLRHRVARAARTGTLEPETSPTTLRPAPGTLAGATPEPVVLRQLSPVGQVVRDLRPELRWTPREEATGYVVYLAVSDGRSPVLRQELPGNTTSWKPPTPLTRGATYEWQVEARENGNLIDRAPRPPAPEVRFQVLDAARAAELVQLEKRHAGHPLVLGVAYARDGLETEALAQFTALEKQHPNSPAAARLLQSARETWSR